MTIDGLISLLRRHRKVFGDIPIRVLQDKRYVLLDQACVMEYGEGFTVSLAGNVDDPNYDVALLNGYHVLRRKKYRVPHYTPQQRREIVERARDNDQRRGFK